MTIRVLAASPDPLLDHLISAFHQRYPQYRVDPVVSDLSPGDAQFRIIQEEVDVVPTVGSLAELVGTDLLFPLDQLIARDGVDLTHWGPALEQLRVGGQLYELPVAVEPWVLIYNQELLHRAGVTIPEAGWTWEELRATARRLTAGAGAAQIWGFAAAAMEPLVGVWAQQQSGLPVWAGGEEAVRDGLRFFHTLIFADGASPPVPPRNWDEQDPVPLEDKWRP